MHIRLRETDIRAVSGEPTPDDLALLRSEEYAGAELVDGEVQVRRMLLAHDQHDRSFERFPRPYLDRFAETLPGKSVLPGHDKSALPLARFFRAEVVSRREEFASLVQPEKTAGEGQDKAAEIVPGFEPRQRTVRFLMPGYYYPKDAASEELDNRVRLGVYRSTSIGFRYDDLDCDLCRKSYFSDCPHIFGRFYEDTRRIASGTYSGDAQKAEALEGSFVFLGAQQNARNLKSMLDAGEVDVAALVWTPYGEDLVTLKAVEQLAREFGHKQKAWALKFKSLSSAAAGETGEAAATPTETLEPSETATDKEHDMALLEEARKRLGLADTADEAAVLVAMEQAVKAAGEKAALETAKVAAETEAETVKTALAADKPYAEIGKKALEAIAKEYVDHCKRLEESELQAGAIAELFTGKNDYDGLKKLVDEKFTAVCAKYPATPRGVVLDDDAPPPVTRTARPREFALV
jgi:hypothetical protein